MVIINAATALAFLIQASAVISVDLGAPIVRCSAVGCPSSQSNSSLPDCHVGDVNSNLIGLASFKSSINDEDFTWTETFNAPADGAAPSTNFYLGSPQGPSLIANATSSGFGSCALFLPIVGLFSFIGQNLITAPTCDVVLGADCVAALLSQATMVVGSTGNSSRCIALQSEFRNSIPSQCSTVLSANSRSLKGSTDVIDLTGPTAPTPLSEAANSTSNCWPTLPKTNSLTPMPPVHGSGNNTFHPSDVQPILTVFFPTNGSSTAILTKPEAQLTCLKPVETLPGATSEGAMRVTSKLGVVLGSILAFWFMI